MQYVAMIVSMVFLAVMPFARSSLKCLAACIAMSTPPSWMTGTAANSFLA